jgi:hypothetical protein
MFGDDLLVAPVTTKADSTGLASVNVWLPEGDWFEWSSGTTLRGDTALTRKFTMEEIPVYARAGSVIPMFPQVDRLGSVPDTLVLSVVPGPAGGGRLYEDDGTTDAYRGDGFAVTRFMKETPAPGTVRVTIDARDGTFDGMKRSRAYVVEFPSTLPPSSVRVNGTNYQAGGPPGPRRWVYDASKLGASVFTPPLDCGSKVVVEVTWTGAGGDGTSLLSGVAGLIARLPVVANIMKDEVNLRDQIANAPATVLAAASIGTMIAYQPDRTAEIVRGFRADLPDLIADVVGYPGGSAAALSPIVALLSADSLVTDSPVIAVDSAESNLPVKVTMSSSIPGASIRYTLDGSQPDDSSKEYAGPFTLGRTAEIRARTFAPGLVPGFASTAAFRLAFAKSVSYAAPNDPRYDGGGPNALVDGRFGGADNFRKQWVGFQGEDLVATVELDAPRDVSAVAVRCLQSQRNWIFLPVEVTIETSRDGSAWQAAGKLDVRAESLAESPMPGVRTLGAAVKQPGVRYVRITAKSPGDLPSWHPSAGKKAWLFADEIVLE